MDLLNNEPKIDNNNKKIMSIILVIVGILVVLSVILVCWIMYLQSTVLKVSIDGVQKSFEEGFFVFEENEVYVPIKEFAKLVGYDVYNGEYRKNTEDTNKCYIETINEVATFSLGSNKIYKINPGETSYESFTIENPVKNINGKLYISSEGIKIACNVSFIHYRDQNSIVIWTLPKLVESYTSVATKAGYAMISADFSSQKALLQELIVGQKENGKLGVINLKGEDVIGAKYDAISFLESTKEFFVTNDVKKVGILSIKGETKIPLENDGLQLLDNDLRLYLATSNGKKGVLDKNGKIIIYREYDEIGIDSTLFPSNDIKNEYLLFDNAIPVMKDGKYGLFDKNGKEILPLNYSGFGYVASTTKDKSVNNLLVLPEYEGIVLNIDYGEEQNKIKKYGIVNSLGEELVPFGLEEIYSITSQGKEEYFVVYQGNTLSLNQIKINKTTSSAKDTNDETEENEKSNTNTNELNSYSTNTTLKDNTNTVNTSQNNGTQNGENQNDESHQNGENQNDESQNGENQNGENQNGENQNGENQNDESQNGENKNE